MVTQLWMLCIECSAIFVLLCTIGGQSYRKSIILYIHVCIHVCDVIVAEEFHLQSPQISEMTIYSGRGEEWPGKRADTQEYTCTISTRT